MHNILLDDFKLETYRNSYITAHKINKNELSTLAKKQNNLTITYQILKIVTLYQALKLLKQIRSNSKIIDVILN